MKKVFFYLAMSVSLLLNFMSCDIGLGKEVDLVAPELKVVSPVNNSFAPKSFKIHGTMKDNEKVESVEIKYSYNENGEKIIKTVNANLIDPEHWEYEFSFDKDYEVTFEVRAYDKNNNSGENTSQTLTVLIDSQDPDASKMGIRRGAYVARLLPVEEFTKEGGKTALRESPENKDYFQNVSFLLFSQLKDLNGIKEAILSLYEVNPETKAEALVLGGINPDAGGNIYSPEYSITREMLEGASSSLSSGIHYLRPHIFVKDEAGNHIEKTFEVFAWESAYDVPHVVYRTMEEYKDESGNLIQAFIKVQQGYSIPVTVFDDDGLGSISYKLIKGADSISINSISDFVQVKDVSGGIRDKSFEIPTSASTEDGAYKLVVKVVDTVIPAVYLEAVDVKITNGDAPTIIVDSPVENTIPDLDAGKFTIKGRTIDNQPVEKIAIGWLPDGNSDIEKAEAALAEYNFENDQVIEGIQFYVLDAGTATHSENKYINAFSKTYDVFEDFKNSSGTVINANKVFMIVAKDSTDNISTKTYRLNAFSSKPTFTVEYSQDGGASWKSTDNPLVTLPLVKTLFRITPVAKNNMGIDVFTMDAEGHRSYSQKDANTFELTDGNGNAPASGEVVNINLYAKDRIGNEGRSKLTVAFDEVGVLQSIEANYAKGKVFNKNDKVITLQVNFSSAVEFYPSTAKPTIALKAKKRGKTSSEEIGKAIYRAGNGTNTLYFDYTLPSDLECSELSLPEGSNPIDTSMCSSLSGRFNGSYTTNKESGTDVVSSLSIDTLAPYIVSYSPEIGKVIEKTDGKIEIKITFNEPVNIESGTLIMQRADPEEGGRWYLPPVIEEDVFLSMYNSHEADEKPEHRVSLTGDKGIVTPGKDKNEILTMIAAGPYMQYTHGIIEKDNEMIPDISKTRYVLNYDFDINGVDEKTEKVRKALEYFNYHKASFDMNSNSISGSGTDTITIEVTDSDFTGSKKIVNGVEYFITLTEKCVADGAFNYIEESAASKADMSNTEKLSVANNEYRFWVGPTAEPVIRVNRIATNKNDDDTCGKTTAKIDCETPNVEVYYFIDDTSCILTEDKSQNNVVRTMKGITPAKLNEYIENVKSHSNSEKYKKQTGIKGSWTIGGNINPTAIGDGKMTTAQKIYIVACAEKKEKLNISECGKEGAFKTQLHYENPSKADEDFKVLGAQIPEANSFTPGWPLTQNVVNKGPDKYQVAYKNGDNKDYYWVSWQVLSDFTLQTHAGGYQNPANPKTTYCMSLYTKNQAYF